MEEGTNKYKCTCLSVFVVCMIRAYNARVLIVRSILRCYCFTLIQILESTTKDTQLLMFLDT